MVGAVRAIRIILTIVLIGASAFVIGSGIAAIPYWENEPCIGFLSETGPSVNWATTLVPYGTRCEHAVAGGSETVQVLAPSTGEWLAWLLVVAAVFAASTSLRRYASARGMAYAAAVLGLFGLLAHQLGAAALMGAVVLGAPLVLAGEWLMRPDARWMTSLVLCLSLPLGVIAVWFVPGFMAFEEIAAALAVLAGAGLAAAVERVAPTFDQWLQPSRP